MPAPKKTSSIAAAAIDRLRDGGFVFAMGLDRGVWRADVWMSSPGLPMPAELRWLGAGLGPTLDAALSSLRALLADARITESSFGVSGKADYVERLRRESVRAAAELAAAGVPLPVDNEEAA